ncbi:hypothetical protein [Agromyces sp. SYSU T00194]|uniref:hypothetical protein n=1 Tax=Agromyces chitinivorans TaxID=3158560 RepID=UPI0033919260
MSEFARALEASAPEPSLAGELALFGRFVGTWAVRNRYRPGPEADWVESERTWIFSWIAGGRAVQDVIVGSDRGAEPVTAGTTVRAYDPALGAWRVQWFGTLHGNHCALVARAHGDDGIRQDGVEFVDGAEVPIRWNFSAIGDDAFEWDGWSSADGGATWWLEQHMRATRVTGGVAGR